MAATVEVRQNKLEVLTTQTLFKLKQKIEDPAFCVSKDGKRFLIDTLESKKTVPITLILNWTSDFKNEMTLNSGANGRRMRFLHQLDRAGMDEIYSSRMELGSDRIKIFSTPPPPPLSPPPVSEVWSSPPPPPLPHQKKGENGMDSS